jgi:vesicle-fusing ATPase
MFNRNNLPSVSNPFGSRPSRGDGYSSPGQAPPPYPRREHSANPAPAGGVGYEHSSRPPDYDVLMTDVSNNSRGYGTPMGRPGQPPQMPSRAGGNSGRTWTLRPAKSPDNTYTFGNL